MPKSEDIIKHWVEQWSAVPKEEKDKVITLLGKRVVDLASKELENLQESSEEFKAFQAAWGIMNQLMD